jgi:hypothetical protein
LILHSSAVAVRIQQISWANGLVLFSTVWPMRKNIKYSTYYTKMKLWLVLNSAGNAGTTTDLTKFKPMLLISKTTSLYCTFHI